MKISETNFTHKSQKVGRWATALHSVSSQLLIFSFPGNSSPYRDPLARLDQALNVLSRALERNRHHSALWLLYMELYSQRPERDHLVALCEQGATFTRNYHVWFKVSWRLLCVWFKVSWRSTYVWFKVSWMSLFGWSKVVEIEPSSVSPTLNRMVSWVLLIFCPNFFGIWTGYQPPSVETGWLESIEEWSNETRIYLNFISIRVGEENVH